MASEPPTDQINNSLDGQAVFGALRDTLVGLYPREQDARAIVDDAGLAGTQIAFSTHAETNWQHILAEVIRHQRLERLLSIVHTSHGDNLSWKAAYTQYRHFIKQGGVITLPAQLSTDHDTAQSIDTAGGTYVAGDVTTKEGDFVGRDKHVQGDEVEGNKIEGDQIDARGSKGFINRPTGPITQHYSNTINLGSLKLPKPFIWMMLAFIVMSGGFIVYTFINTRSHPSTLTIPTPMPLPTPTPLQGDFNVAVVPFVQATAQNNANTALMRQLSEQIYRALDQELASLREAGFVIPVRSPTDTMPIIGEDDQTLDLAAQTVATTINADLIIYSKLEILPARTTFTPAFWLDSRRLVYAEEAGGPYKLTPVEVEGSINANAVSNQELRSAVAVQAEAFAKFVVGLGYFAHNRYPEAAHYLEEAKVQAGTDDKSVAEVTYLFLGSVAAKLHDPTVAKVYYTRALEFNDRSPRALLGVAQMQFLQARRDCEPDNVDIAGLQAAVTNYQRVLTFPSLPSAQIPTKSALMLGHAYLCLSQAQQADHWTDAQAQYEEVLRNYAAEESVSIRYLAAEAAAGLGLLILLRDASHAPTTLQQATQKFNDALNWSRQKDRQAVYKLWQVQIQLWQNECAGAKSALGIADRLIAEFTTENPELTDPEFAVFRQDIVTALVAQCSESGA
jgi:hypothetical protein